MRKIFLLALLCIIAGVANAQNNNYKVVAELKNCTDTSATMTIWNSQGTTGGKVSIKNGKFQLAGFVDEPMMIRVEFSDKKVYKYVSDGGYIPFKCSSLWLLVYPGANVKVKGKLTDFVDAYPSGDVENNTLTKLTSLIYPLMNKSGNLRVKMECDKTLSEEQIKTFEAENAQIDREITQHLRNFVAKYPSSYAAVWFLDDMLIRRQISPQEAESIVASVAPKYRDNEWFKSVEQRVKSVKYSVGAQLPEIVSSLTPDNTNFNSSSLKGKFVIIDFWGAWCGPCMSGMDALRSFRDKHKGKVELLGIAKDTKDGWLRTIKNRNLNWVHILNGKAEEDFVAKFNVTGFPTKILISPEGKILYRESGESEEFYNKVEEFLK